MAEIICPNCGARYNIPDDVLGENGRKVTCSVCGHTWHAMPAGEEAPLVLDDPVAAPEPMEAAAAAAAVAAPAMAEAAAERTPSAQDLRAARAKQLAEIRQIVDEVQSAPDPASSYAGGPAAPVPGSLRIANLAYLQDV
ncbi:MAG: zinc-ribbon domain-containing protein [Pseudomonadota bacterium]